MWEKTEDPKLVKHGTAEKGGERERERERESKGNDREERERERRTEEETAERVWLAGGLREFRFWRLFFFGFLFN